MPTTYYTKVTTSGQNKLAAALVSQTPVPLTHFAVGDANGAYYEPTGNEAALVHEVWRAAVNRVYQHQNNANWVVVEAIIPASQGGFDIREAAVFDAEGDMIAIGKYPLTNKPLPGSGSEKDLYVRLIMQVTNATTVQQTIDMSLVLATKEYVDGRDWKGSARAATTGNIALTGLLILDGVQLAEDDRVLVKDQGVGSQNGIYVAKSGAWQRALDADSALEVTADMVVIVEEGAVNSDTIWLLTTSAPITVGTTALTFTRIFPDESVRTISDAAAPTSDTGTPTTLFGWIANVIKGITGKASWRTAPATTLEAAKGHMDASAPHAGHVNHALATAANDMLVASGAGTFVKKTLAEVKGILGLGDAAYKNTGTVAGSVAAGDHGHGNTAAIGGPYALSGHNHSGTYEPANANIQSHIAANAPHAGHVNHALATAPNDMLVASGAGAFVKKTLAEVKTILGLGDAAYKNTGTWAGSVAAGDHGHGNTAAIGGPYALSGHNHSGTYEPANANIQSHISASAPHAGHALLGHGHANDANIGGPFAPSGHGHANDASIGGPFKLASVFNWAGQAGQPTWLWGSNDGSSYYVWNPANFSVSNATTVGGRAVTTGHGAGLVLAAGSLGFLGTIAEYTFPGGISSVTISGLDGNTHEMYELIIFGQRASAGFSPLLVRFNGDAGANYAYNTTIANLGGQTSLHIGYAASYNFHYHCRIQARAIGGARTMAHYGCDHDGSNHAWQHGIGSWLNGVDNLTNLTVFLTADTFKAGTRLVLRRLC
ncbi:phage tail protein [Geobacter sp.]|uniref:phage tail protein n=1 Tax=Geobacter sp. TaxID=46610 RepID=UPI00262782B9|nr:phage tail protein [Geobacter sp.]